MSMKKIGILLIMLFTSNSIYSYDWKYDWNEIADSIAIKQKEVCDSMFFYKIDLYKSLRKGYSIRKYADSTIVEGDTIIIMEYHNPYKSTTNCVTWIKSKPSSFITYDKYLNINRDVTICYWSFYMRRLCNDWNIEEIRKEELVHPYEPMSPDNKAYILATRVVLKPHKQYNIDTVFFGHFILLSRDKF